ncbi:MAG: Helix-turn-helix domain protein [Parcubacteria group bacterium GW2011_GWC2_45_7]|uniref:Helix-turn-helix domain protein n=1 Tax=Candidatus Magasanikbacteria bacterium GW2011_GWA2_50_22 TaxID=1619043 RepID=A0A0G1YQV8_9BACT|nr:MAG: Helix-turn-helix domain protein [Parcubacteria group bacterium GW2011_GWC2_45_7]KKW17402.1 MAG: Helix-turn-helix domain protein [Candidatus Magasanikbacteria bacterium GW2011_GWA2_50_22]
MKSYAEVKKQLLKDSEVRKAYDELKVEFALIAAIIEKRIEKGLTQAALARKIGTKQSAIARLESGNYNPSLAFLEKVAKALGTKLEVSLL